MARADPLGIVATGGRSAHPRRSAVAAVAAALGVLAFAAQLVVALVQGVWREPAHSHAPLVILAAAALFAIEWRRGAAASAQRPGPGALGLAAALAGLAYTAALVGLWLEVPLATAAPWLLLPAAALIAAGGFSLLRRCGFVLVLLAFALPPPQFVVEAISTPMKAWVAQAAVALLAGAGLPVGLEGAVVAIGGYRLLVADACAGLHSLLMLEAFGLLYVHLAHPPSAARKLLLAAAIVPVAFAANVVRVVLLLLVTWNFGEAAGQGLVHDHAGLVLFAAGLMLLVPLDATLRRLFEPTGRGPRAVAEPNRTPPSNPRFPRPAMRRLLLLALPAVAAAAVASALRRAPVQAAGLPSEADALPERVGRWRRLERAAAVAVPAAIPGDGEPPYDRLLTAEYASADAPAAPGGVGETTSPLLLTVAWAAAQSPARRLHEPPACYAAAGFVVRPWRVPAAGGLARRAMVARRGARHEVVVWRVRLGHLVEPSRAAALVHFAAERLEGRAPDGLLLRASRLLPAAAGEAAQWRAVAQLDEFLRAWPPGGLRRGA
jgi:exosortase